MGTGIDGDMGRTARKVVIEYGDGGTRELGKGMCLEFHGEADGRQAMTADMLGMAVPDLVAAAVALVEIVDRMGLSGAMDEYIRRMGGTGERHGSGGDKEGEGKEPEV